MVKFYVAIKDKTPFVKTTWEDCKKMRSEQKGVCIKSFSDADTAIAWAEKKGCTLEKSAIPSFVLNSEPVLSRPVVISHIAPIVKETEVKIFTDGSCLSNPGGPGGFGSIVLLPDGKEVHISGREASSTNNRMEIMAALSVLDYVVTNNLTKEEVIICTDSLYLRNTFEKRWIKRWQSNGWKTKDGKAVQNRDLLEVLEWLVNTTKAKFAWVKSHNGHKFNEMANRLAIEEAKHAARECGFPLECEKPCAIPLPANSSFNRKKLTGSVTLSIVEEKHQKDMALQEKVKQDEESLPFSLSYRVSSMGKQKKKSGHKSLNPTGNTVRKASLRVELKNGNLMIIPISEKQNEIINLVLGIDAQDNSTAVRVFDDLTLEKILSCKENPLPELVKKYKRPFYR